MNAAYAPGLRSVPGVPRSAADAAGHSLGEAYEVSGRLGGGAGAALRRAARDSFVHGLHVTLLVSAGLLLLGAVLALRLPWVMQCGEEPGGAEVELPAPGRRSRPPASPGSPPDPGCAPSCPDVRDTLPVRSGRGGRSAVTSAGEP